MTECNNFELNLHNFQSISNANLEFSKGINLIVGQSNSGKTAALRAIKATVMNASGGQRFIKQGTDEAVVDIRYKNNDIKWERTKKESKYTINNEEYIKVGNSNLFKILEDNGFVIDDKNNIMNIEGELDLPFPFDRTSAELFKLFENIFCVSDSATILKAIKDEEDSNIKNKNKLLEESNKVVLKLSALEELNQEVSIEKLRTFKIDYSNLLISRDKFSEDFKIINNSNNLITKLNLSSTEETYFLNDSVQKYLDYIADYNNVIKCKKLNNLITESAEPPSLDNTLTQKYTKLSNDYIKLLQVKELIDIDFREINIDTSVIDKLIKMRKDFKSFGVLIKLSKLFKEEKEVVLSTDNISKLEKLTNDYAFLLGAEEIITSFEKQVKEKELELERINKELEQFDVCPLCGNTLMDEKGN